MDPIPVGQRCLPAITTLHNYKADGDLSFRIERLYPNTRTTCYLYIATSTKEPKEILVKLVKRYCIELHALCAEMGFAPSILGYERLAGDWYGVAMENFKDGLRITHPEVMDDARDHGQKWEQDLRGLVDCFHQLGYVHGDLRDANILCKGDCVKLIDFDWGGKEGQVEYPTKRLHDDQDSRLDPWETCQLDQFGVTRCRRYRKDFGGSKLTFGH